MKSIRLILFALCLTPMASANGLGEVEKKKERGLSQPTCHKESSSCNEVWQDFYQQALSRLLPPGRLAQIDAAHTTKTIEITQTKE
jgi:hypothetical protein